ncbi:MAG: CPBP family intramembrane metalloprotease [Anaerolineae bacterium]|nr:CPBP family intramembrane metalloprotease [Anaerolineae bacterium]
MEALRQLATNLPIVFGLLTTIAVFVFSIVSFVLGMALPAGSYKPYIGQILGRLLTTLLFVFILSRFGWLSAVGFTRFAEWQSWLPILLLLVYTMVAAVYAFFGDFKLELSKPKLVGVVALDQMTIGLLEEIAYRGIILYTFVRIWGDSNWGLVGSVLLSAALFGASHLVWVLFGKPPLQSMLMSLSAFEAGIYYAVFVLASGSIWPAVLFHGLVNAVVNVKLIDQPDYKETVSSGVRMALLGIPVVAYGVYLLWNMPPLATIPNVP